MTPLRQQQGIHVFLTTQCNCTPHQPHWPMFEQTFKNIDDILHKDAGCTSELDYTEQSSWLLFLKYLDALERDKAAMMKL